MKKIIYGALALMFGTSIALADWPLDKMNTYIDNTNWVLDGKCSATTLDVEAQEIITNWHCVSTASTGKVVLSQYLYQDFEVVKQVSYVAEVVKIDPLADLAKLRIVDDSIKLVGQAKLAEKNDIMRGQKVYLVGNPEMLENTLVVGYISATQRSITTEGTPFPRKYFQVSGGVTGGASGGAVYNEDGEFIGITAASSAKSAYLGFAIPLSVIKEFLKN
jgi:S1-C subfamily serine protease